MTFSVSSFTSHLHKMLSIFTAGCLHHHTAGTVVIEPSWECALTVIDSWCAWVYTMSGHIVFAQVGVKREEVGGRSSQSRN